MIGPGEFFETYVAPAIAEWRANPSSIRLATLALCELDNLAEHVIIHTNPRVRKGEVTQERDKLAGAKPELGLARDIHDTHKHGPLARKSASITKGQRPWSIPGGRLEVMSPRFGTTTINPSELVISDEQLHECI